MTNALETPLEVEARPGERSLLAHLYGAAPSSVTFKKIRKRLLQQAEETIRAYAMVPTGSSRPRWLVCLSGGKDSYTLLALLLDLKAQGRLDADLLACNLDQGQPGFPKETLPNYLSGLGMPFRIETKDTYSIVTEKVPETKTYCSLCSRLRRGHLYRIAREEKCDAIVLGHHRDDALQTFFMNLFFGGRLAALAPKLRNDDGDLLVLRPLLQSAEDDIAKFADGMAFPIIPCTLCGSQDGLQRQAMAAMLKDWQAKHPGRIETMFKALKNVRPTQLPDAGLIDFEGL
ncbi:MAG: tRNA 2-thiocytidine(32) synthetase TtcA [Pseudomonadota bacterium]